MTLLEKRSIFCRAIQNHSEIDTGTSDGKTYPIEAFFNRLRELCQNDGRSDGADWRSSQEEQAKQTVALARELGLLIRETEDWLTFSENQSDTGCFSGTEHLVSFDQNSGDVIKITKPPGFGLIPRVKSFRVPNLRDPDSDTYRRAIEFDRATPLEYLERWICSNEVFEDDVRLASVVNWADDSISFVIRQPHYGGKPTTQRDIDRYFEECRWTHLRRETNHTVYFNYAFGVLAIDALPRNCYRSEEGLNPFDVILCKPDEELEKYLEIYPG